MRNVAVLLTCHNRREKTLRCLDLLFVAKSFVTDYTFDVFLVDDGSTDDTANAVTEKHPEIHIINGTGKLYWNRGMLLAWETAVDLKEFDYYIWLNDDTFLFQNSLKLLFRSINEKSITIGTTTSELNKKVTYGGFSKNHQLIIPNGNFQKCYYFNGNCVIIPNYVFRKVGFLDKRFSHAVGDFDYGLRAKKLSVELFIASDFVGTCENHDELPKWCNPKTPFIKRIKLLYSPLGCHPFQHFIFEFRHFGLFKASIHFFTIHLRTLIPLLW